MSKKKLNFSITYVFLRKALRRMDNYDTIMSEFSAEYYGYPKENELKVYTIT